MIMHKPRDTIHPPRIQTLADLLGSHLLITWTALCSVPSGVLFYFLRFSSRDSNTFPKRVNGCLRQASTMGESPAQDAGAVTGTPSRTPRPLPEQEGSGKASKPIINDTLCGGHDTAQCCTFNNIHCVTCISVMTGI